MKNSKNNDIQNQKLSKNFTQNALQYAKKSTTQDLYFEATQNFQFYMKLTTGPESSQRNSYNNKQVEVIEIKYIKYSEKQLTEEFIGKFSRSHFVQCWGFFDILTLKQIFQYMKKHASVDGLGVNNNSLYYTVAFKVQFNNKQYQKQSNLELSKSNIDSEQKCRQYMNFKQKINNHRLSVMLSKIEELEQYKKKMETSPKSKSYAQEIEDRWG